MNEMRFCVVLCAVLSLLYMTIVSGSKTRNNDALIKLQDDQLAKVQRVLEMFISKDKEKPQNCENYESICRNEVCKIVSLKFLCEKKNSIRGVKEMLEDEKSRDILYQYVIIALGEITPVTEDESNLLKDMKSNNEFKDVDDPQLDFATKSPNGHKNVLNKTISGSLFNQLKGSRERIMKDNELKETIKALTKLSRKETSLDGDRDNLKVKRSIEDTVAISHKSQTQSGQPRSQGSATSGPIGNMKNIINKDTTVNRIDDIKLNDPNVVQQALNDINKSKDKRDVDVDSNCIDDGVNAGDDKVDADGFQEVRSKKNVKDSRGQQQQKDEQQSSKPSGRRDKERERDRSKSKSNGAQSQQGPAGQQGQNATDQPIGQAGAGAPPKQYERNANRQKLAPRFQKARLAKQRQQQGDGAGGKPLPNAAKEGAAPPPPVNAWDKPFTGGSRSPPAVPADIQLMSGLTASSTGNDQDSAERNSPKVVEEKSKDQSQESKAAQDALIFKNINHVKPKRSSDLDDESSQLQQQQALAAAFSNKPSDLIKEKQPEPIQMPLSFNNKEDSSDMKLDFTFDSDLSQLTDDKSKSLDMPRSMHITSGQSTISPSTAELNLKIASVKKVWENAPPMPTVVKDEVDQNVVSSANSFPQTFENNDDDGYTTNQQYSQGSMKNEITTSTNICKVKPKQETAAGGGGSQAGGLYYDSLQQDQSRSSDTPCLPPASNAPMNRLQTAAAPSSSYKNQQFGSNPSTALVLKASSTSLVAVNVKPTSQAIGAVGSYVQTPAAPPQPKEVSHPVHFLQSLLAKIWKNIWYAIVTLFI